MDSDSDGNVLECQRVVSELLDASLVQRLRGNWEVASRLRHHGLVLLVESKPKFSLPRVRFYIDDVTDDSCLIFYRFTRRQLRRLLAAFGLPDVIRWIAFSYVLQWSRRPLYRHPPIVVSFMDAAVWYLQTMAKCSQMYFLLCDRVY
ncbi:hypothetical protein GN958_ATG07648 [Phytophthora infestans]|uniref:Uncharacterized protein n=1 Tax=Phytophthora infestans TaxID=4787 RepID=A0A8S9UQI3_PHYIN|nr:hypothetical protein GN958_ATG07648 [Phytophthora infestans]